MKPGKAKNVGFGTKRTCFASSSLCASSGEQTNLLQRRGLPAGIGGPVQRRTLAVEVPAPDTGIVSNRQKGRGDEDSPLAAGVTHPAVNRIAFVRATGKCVRQSRDRAAPSHTRSAMSGGGSAWQSLVHLDVGHISV